MISYPLQIIPTILHVSQGRPHPHIPLQKGLSGTWAARPGPEQRSQSPLASAGGVSAPRGQTEKRAASECTLGKPLKLLDMAPNLPPRLRSAIRLAAHDHLK